MSDEREPLTAERMIGEAFRSVNGDAMEREISSVVELSLDPRCIRVAAEEWSERVAMAAVSVLIRNAIVKNPIAFLFGGRG